MPRQLAPVSLSPEPPAPRAAVAERAVAAGALVGIERNRRRASASFTK
jgi:hypothetical protein